MFKLIKNHDRKLNNLCTIIVTALIIQLTLSFSAFGQSELTTEQVTDSIYIVKGNGGNIGVFIGTDGTFMIDDKFAGMSADVLAAVKSIGGDRPTYLVNTHFHGDHTGGNTHFGKAGSTIVAHYNVRKRLAEGSTIAAFSMTTPPAADSALPDITFSESVTFHINGEKVVLFHAPNAHTDGDSVVHFTKANVIHTGDLFFNGFYPFIDVSNGGNVQGMINAADQILGLSNAQTKIIPGHGPLTDINALKTYRTMLSTVQQRLSAIKSEGKTAEQAIAEAPLKDLEAQWGKGIFTGDKWIGIIYGGI